MNLLNLHESDESGRDEEFVGQRVQKSAQDGDLIAGSSNLPIVKISEARRDKEDERGNPRVDVVAHGENQKERHEKQPEKSEPRGQIDRHSGSWNFVLIDSEGIGWPSNVMATSRLRPKRIENVPEADQVHVAPSGINPSKDLSFAETRSQSFDGE